jgi:hypothetical protein
LKHAFYIFYTSRRDATIAGEEFAAFLSSEVATFTTRKGFDIPDQEDP